MNESRRQILLENQSTLAQKTYEFVPIQSAWSCTDIHRAMISQSATSSAFRVIRACLGELKDQKIIREPKPGMFQRDADRSKAVVQPYERLLQQESGVTSNGMIIKESKTFKALPVSTQEVLALTPQAPTESEEKKEIMSDKEIVTGQTANAIDMMTELAVDLGDFTATIGKALSAFATRIEEIAGVVEADQTQTAEKLKKFQALQSLLKDLQ